MCSFLDKEADSAVKTLMALAAVLHDIGKASFEWQEYIQGARNKGPNHSECGAVMFSYIAYHFLKKKGIWQKYYDLWLMLTRDIADHHGKLKGYVHNEDLHTFAFGKMDLPGISLWLQGQFPFLKELRIEITEEKLDDWQYTELKEIVEEALDELYDDLRENANTIEEMMDYLQKWRDLTTKLIAADRFAITDVDDVRLSLSDWLQMQENLQAYCIKAKNHPLDHVRKTAQEMILKQWREDKLALFYTLEMPTGYGKTITSLKIAAEMAKEFPYSKLIYVAPYLSILEQNSEAIEKTAGYTPLQHHSMAILMENKRKNEKNLNENDKEDTLADLEVQSWAGEIIATSFVQWMKAVFPRRAQETLRRIFLRDSIIIIDEPQIIDTKVWNLFLKGLESLTKQMNFRVIFCSATLPPFFYGLNQKPVRLSVGTDPSVNRYCIKVTEPTNAEECAHRLSNTTEPSSAVIVNTIQDAIDVYTHLPSENHVEKILLHGLMTPLHKKIQINKIHHLFEEQRKGRLRKRIQVVSTQILEAGVNLSFHYLFRACPLLPSLAQAAGRVNRHGEKAQGIVETGIFFREGKDTREYIYSKNLIRISDELLFQKDMWMEYEMMQLVNQFYANMFKENDYTAVFTDVEKAVHGNWTSLSSHEVFANEEEFRLPIFIPVQWKGLENFIPFEIINLMEHFNINDSKQIYEIYMEKQLKESSYQERKKFNLLFNMFVLNVPAEKALRLVPKENFLTQRIPILENEDAYDLERGLLFEKGDVNNSAI